MTFVFENWQVYKDARELRKEINDLIKKWPKDEKFVLIDQIKRAVLSIMLQIAEGSNRKTDKDKSAFFNRSHTSLDEVVACLDAALDSGYLTKTEYDYFCSKCENIAKQFRGLIKYLNQGPKDYRL